MIIAAISETVNTVSTAKAMSASFIKHSLLIIELIIAY